MGNTTIRQWFEACTDAALRSKLLANLLPEFENNTVDSYGKSIDSQNKAIQCGFYWGSTPEGFDFWNQTTNFQFAPKD